MTSFALSKTEGPKPDSYSHDDSILAVQVCRKHCNVDDELVGELKGTVGRILTRSKDGCTSDSLLFSLTGTTCMATIPEELMGDIIPGGPDPSDITIRFALTARASKDIQADEL